jgi:hypothetical protein
MQPASQRPASTLQTITLTLQTTSQPASRHTSNQGADPPTLPIPARPPTLLTHLPPPTHTLQGEPCDLSKFGTWLSHNYIPNNAIVDCTASDGPAQHYLQWMQEGIHIITPNKKLGSGPLAQYQAVRRMQRESLVHFFYEGTVGAGLPVIGTLKHLLETGARPGAGLTGRVDARRGRGSSVLGICVGAGAGMAGRHPGVCTPTSRAQPPPAPCTPARRLAPATC